MLPIACLGLWCAVFGSFVVMGAIVGVPVNSMFTLIAYVGTPPLAVFAGLLIVFDLMDIYRRDGTIVPKRVATFARRQRSRGRAIFARLPRKLLLRRLAG